MSAICGFPGDPICKTSEKQLIKRSSSRRKQMSRFKAGQPFQTKFWGNNTKKYDIWIFPKIGVITPKSSILIGFGTIIFTIHFGGTIIFGGPPIYCHTMINWHTPVLHPGYGGCSNSFGCSREGRLEKNNNNKKDLSFPSIKSSSSWSWSSSEAKQ